LKLQKEAGVSRQNTINTKTLKRGKTVTLGSRDHGENLDPAKDKQPGSDDKRKAP
jgi:hypothetical protein